jgi:hypothetical protein
LGDYGPVDVIVASLSTAYFDGRVLATIEQFTKSGAIRVLDAMLIVMDEDGTIRGLDVEDVGPRMQKCSDTCGRTAEACSTQRTPTNSPGA